MATFTLQTCFVRQVLARQGYVYIYLRRQQERGLMQKARRLMDENSISFQMFLNLLSFITLGSESQIPCSKKVRAILRCLFCFVSLYGGSMHRSQYLEIFNKKKTS